MEALPWEQQKQISAVHPYSLHMDSCISHEGLGSKAAHFLPLEAPGAGAEALDQCRPSGAPTSTTNQLCDLGVLLTLSRYPFLSVQVPTCKAIVKTTLDDAHKVLESV